MRTFQGPALQAPYSDQSVRSSFRQSYRPTEITCTGHIFFSLGISGSFFTYREPLGKGCAVIINQVFWSKAMVIAELCEKFLFGSYIFPFGPSQLILYPHSAVLLSRVLYLAHSSDKRSFWEKDEQRVSRSNVKVMADLFKIRFLATNYFPFTQSCSY